MKKYLAFLKISLKKSLEYRARIFICFFWDIGPALIMMFFWLAVFKTKTQVAGYDFSSMMIYYLVIMFARNLVLTNPDDILQKEIYSGQINIYLPRPANLISLKILYELAYKFIKFLYLIPVFISLYFLFLKGHVIGFNLLSTNLIFFLLSCSLSYCLYFLIKFLIGISAFWFTDAEWLIEVQELIFWFLGGLLLPLDIMPAKLQQLANLLPFKYVFYLPAQGLLGRLSLNQMFISLMIQVFWLILFFVLAKKVFKAGLKIYAAFGG